jgi:hypothetical protein
MCDWWGGRGVRGSDGPVVLEGLLVSTSSCSRYESFSLFSGCVPCVVQVTLQGTPSTGYKWIMNTTTPGYEMVHLENASQTDVPPDNFAFNLTVISKTKGRYPLEWDYKQVWKSGPGVQTAVLNVCVAC